MSGVATYSQPPPQPRSSGRKRKPVSYAEDPPGEVTEVPVKKRQRRGNAAVDDADASAPAKQTKLESPPAKEKRLKRQDLSTYFCILVRVLKAPPVLQYQLAFLRSELVEIFSKAPPIPSGVPGENDGGRKSVEGDCPICCEDFESTGDAIVWCKAACGNNVHKTCFEQWAATKGGHNVTCPYCRTPWAGDEDMLKDIVKTGEKNAEGYVNVASQLGLDSERDYSTYHPFWVRRQARSGAIDPSWRGFGLWDD
ncbi:hypothetical protein SLS54_005542 [Diplodia seriata]